MILKTRSLYPPLRQSSSLIRGDLRDDKTSRSCKQAIHIRIHVFRSRKSGIPIEAKHTRGPRCRTFSPTSAWSRRTCPLHNGFS